MNTNHALKFNPHVAAAPIYVGGATIEAIQKQYGLEHVIKMASNESPLGPSPQAVEAIQKAALMLNRYPPMGDEDFRNVLAGAIGQGMTAGNFVTGNGGCDILAMIAANFLQPGDECVIARPTFPVYDITAQRAGASVVYADLHPDTFAYDVEAMLSAITGRTRLLYVCSPNNPTGTIITAGQMETLVNNAPPHVVIVADEVYHHFADHTDFPDTLEYVRQGKNIIVLHSFSKAFGLAGLRLGYAIAPPKLARYLSRARESFHLSRLAIVGGMASLDDRAHLQKIVSTSRQGREWLYRELARLGVQVWPSQSNFVLFKPLCCPGELSEQLLRRGVIVRPMSQFYLPTHLRVTAGLPEENKRFIAALRESLAILEERGVPEEAPAEASGGEFKF
ncbi:MAG: histidinol-phosphate transaminase [Anaerolineae bacterium]